MLPPVSFGPDFTISTFVLASPDHGVGTARFEPTLSDPVTFSDDQLTVSNSGKAGSVALVGTALSQGVATWEFVLVSDDSSACVGVAIKPPSCTCSPSPPPPLPPLSTTLRTSSQSIAPPPLQFPTHPSACPIRRQRS